MPVTQKLKIQSYQVDAGSRLRLNSFLELAQQIGEDDCEAENFGFTALRERDEAWILSKIQILIQRMPLFKEEVSLSSWHSGVSGPLFIRDFAMNSSDGSPIIRCNSSWAIMNLKDRSIQLPSKYSYARAAASGLPSLESLPCKLRLPAGAEMENKIRHTVAYSDLDYNGHTNNSKYALWALDCLGDDAFGREFNEIQMNFNNEVRLGDEVELCKYRTGAGIYVTVCHNGKQSFIIRFN